MRSGSAGRLFSTSTTTSALKQFGASNNMRTFMTASKNFMGAAPESSIPKAFRQMSNTPAQVFKTS